MLQITSGPFRDDIPCDSERSARFDNSVQIDANIAAFGPSQLPKTLAQRISLSSPAVVILGHTYHYSDAPHFIRLLRARDDRQTSRTAEKRNEFAPSHRTPQETPF
jgi:hypothetical protein